MFIAITVTTVFLTALFLGLGIAQWSRRPANLRDKLARFSFKVETGAEPQARRRAIHQIFARVVPRSYLVHKEASLGDADIQLSGAEFVGVQVISFIAVLVVVGVFNIGLGLVAGALAACVPDALVEAKRRARQSRIDEQLIEALSMMTASVKAGYSLQQGMRMVAEEMGDPIRTVFGNLVNDISMGMAMEEALENMAKKTRNAEVELMTVAIRVNRQVGSSISEVLESIQRTVMDRVKLKKNIKVLTAQGRLSGTIISILPVGIALFLYLVDPGYIGVLFTNPLGLVILIGSAMLMGTGILLVRRILDMKV